MAAYDFDIGIIGGGAAGLTVTAGAAQLGAKTVLIEKEPRLGGDCLHFGCVPSKTLLKSANVRHLMKSAARFGLPPGDLPAVDFQHISRRIQSVIDRIQQHDSKERFCKLGARVEFGTPRFTDEQTVELAGKRFSAKNWVVATGSRAVVPPIEGLARTPHITNREIFSLERLPVSMIILGAGPIGIEMAQAFRRLGSEVAVVDMAAQILTNEDADMALEVQRVLEAEGVVFHLKSGITAVTDAGGGRRIVSVQDHAGRNVDITGDTVLVALGRSANCEELGLGQIGVEFDRRGIKVDQRLRTSQRHIYAAGDVNGGYQFTHAAGYEGGIVVSNAIFHLPRKTDYTFLPWCTYTDPELASVGFNEKRARQAGIDYRVMIEPFESNDRSLAEGYAVGQIKLLLTKRAKPIGVQIMGPHAGELVNEWVAAFQGGVKLATLASAVHPYPTLGEVNKKIAGNYYSSKLFSDRVRKVLKLFFRLQGRACRENVEDEMH